jgi:hypothetical protein
MTSIATVCKCQASSNLDFLNRMISSEQRSFILGICVFCLLFDALFC